MAEIENGNLEDCSNEKQKLKSRWGLSSKLLVMTILFVMLSEVLIFVPSIANFRNAWLSDKLGVAGVAATLLSETGHFSPVLQSQLLEATDAVVISYSEGGTHQLIAMSDQQKDIVDTVYMDNMSAWDSVSESLSILFGRKQGDILVVGEIQMGRERQVEMVIPTSSLRSDMVRYSLNILKLSLIISLITAGLVYGTLRWLFVKPMKRIFRSMERFASAPENAHSIIKPTERLDEIGLAEQQLCQMQKKLNKDFHQQRRMAALGLAVSKINHDMRNLLASAQLFSERLELLPDPTVQRITPKILNSLDRAAKYTSAVLSYGKAQEEPPSLRLVSLREVVQDVAEVLGLEGHSDVQLVNNVPVELEVEADPEQLFRVLMNLCRNSVQAMQGDKQEFVIKRVMVEAYAKGMTCTIKVLDTGPGIPANARKSLFKAFHSAGKVDGTGLGLAIAAEIVEAHGGTIKLDESVTTGTCFEITLPHHEQNYGQTTVTQLHS
ncbi:two-component system sensor histidine kinase NtrB [Flexibacterium corallicola]|uniref:two-component system sensor histidine kinase NtrB n=1 Tax=Flexibacterium corallicola TaxID=3037259 RepID=UPI00286F55FF|nr:HAMP domain-containing sensor histidine kinase [Pseudovibrio sp. M1P-2-3]